MRWRNGALFAVGLAATVVSGMNAYRSRGSSGRVNASGMRRAFTLMETLITLAVVVILIAISGAAISRARSAGRDGRIASDLRSHAQGFAAYSAAHKARLPHFTKPGSHSTDLRGGGLEINGVAYFDAFRTWHIPMSDEHYALPGVSDSFFPPGYRSLGDSGWPLYTPYGYPCVFIADPAYWNQKTRIGAEQFRATRLDEVIFPALKSQIVLTWIDRPEPSAHATRYPAAFCDGSYASPSGEQINSGYEFGDSRADVRSGGVHFGGGPPMMHTVDGVRGRDVLSR